MKDRSLIIEGDTYTLVKVRNHAPISIYKGKDSFLRIGPEDLIQQEVDYHMNLVRYGFPVPNIISRGTHLGLHYYIESSIGEEHLGQTFARNSVDSLVSNSNFALLLDVVKKFAQAQINTTGAQTYQFSDFTNLIQVDTILAELPVLAPDTMKAVSLVEKNVTSLPAVLTHGDFNPYNLFEDGVIDWERGSFAPFGYDLITNIVQSFFFPLGNDYEFSALYRFSKDQVGEYWRQLDLVCAEHGVDTLSQRRNDFIFCRSIWSVVRMEKWPRIQAWRYKLYKSLLQSYLRDEDLTQFLLNYK